MDPRQPIPSRPPVAPAERWNPFEQYDQFRRPGMWTPQQVMPNSQRAVPMQPAPMVPTQGPVGPQGMASPEAMSALAMLFAPRR
jgi:hypothetical protein